MDDHELIRLARLELDRGLDRTPFWEGWDLRLAGQVRAIHEIGEPALQFEVERSDRRLDVLDVLSPFLSPPGSWDEILGRLPPAERTLVENRLSDDETVTELFS
jgi:hypothetical protein